MKIKTVDIKEFTAFAKQTIEFSPGLNVFIGANATGKSHLMKLLYSILKVIEPKPGRQSRLSRNEQLDDILANVFMPDDGDIGRLVRRERGRKKATVRTVLTNWGAGFELTTLGRLRFEYLGPPPAKRCIFIPSREALSMYEDFIATYEERELSFDQTYYDLCKALSAKPLRGPHRDDISSLIRPFEKILGGRVVLKGGRFHVTSTEGAIEAHLLAEGFRKLATLSRLIANGSLMQNGILFWDEPEANLNPRLVTRIADAVLTLARNGMQVFVATHDYLLTHRLSLAQEYPKEESVPTKFFSFYRTDDNGVQIESGSTLAEIEYNPILDEYAKLYDDEVQLFANRTPTEGGPQS